MAKIDTSKIDGYDTMTVEDKIKALEAYEQPEPDFSGYVRKDIFDKTASDLAAWKKKYSDQLSEEEKKKQAESEQMAQMQTELAELRREKTVSEYKARFLAQGYSEELATTTALALADGDTDKVFANQQTFLTEYAKQLKADALKDNPRPPAGSGGGLDYAKLIENARANNEPARMAALIRQQQMEIKQ